MYLRSLFFTSHVIIFSLPSKLRGITFSLQLFIGQFSNLYPRFQVKVFTDKSGLSTMLEGLWETGNMPLLLYQNHRPVEEIMSFPTTTKKMKIMLVDMSFFMKNEDLNWDLKMPEISKYGKIKKDVLVGVEAPWSKVQKQKIIRRFTAETIHSFNWSRWLIWGRNEREALLDMLENLDFVMNAKGLY